MADASLLHLFEVEEGHVHGALGVDVNGTVNILYRLLGKGFVVSDDTEIAESFDFSVPVGISYEYANFQLDARYNIGCTKVFKGTDEKNSVFQVTLGYKFDL